MPTRPPFFTPARTKQAIQLLAVVVLLAALTSALHYFQRRHNSIDTRGNIVYASDAGSLGHSHIFITRYDGSGLKQLTTGNENDTQPVFSPDGSSIAFISDRTGSDQVDVMDAKAEQISQISTGSDSKLNPAFSPDGTSVAYLSRGQLLVTDTVSLSTQLLYPISTQPNSSSQGEADPTTAQSVAPVTAFAWSSAKSKGGSDIAVVQEDEDSGYNIVTLIPADASKKPLFMIAGEKVSMAWSLDGSTLAIAVLGVAQFDPKKHDFVSAPVSGIALFDHNGAPLQQPLLCITQTDGAGPQYPAISPDGSQIGFDILAQTKVGTAVNAGLALSQMTPGAQPKQVGQQGSTKMEFSPDGSRVLFLGSPEGAPSRSDLVVVDLKAGEVKDITRGNGNVSSAQWSPTNGIAH